MSEETKEEIVDNEIQEDPGSPWTEPEPETEEPVVPLETPASALSQERTFGLYRGVVRGVPGRPFPDFLSVPKFLGSGAFEACCAQMAQQRPPPGETLFLLEAGSLFAYHVEFVPQVIPGVAAVDGSTGRGAR